jgi:hypothetical protein
MEAGARGGPNGEGEPQRRLAKKKKTLIKTRELEAVQRLPLVGRVDEFGSLALQP